MTMVISQSALAQILAHTYQVTNETVQPKRNGKMSKQLLSDTTGTSTSHANLIFTRVRNIFDELIAQFIFTLLTCLASI